LSHASDVASRSGGASLRSGSGFGGGGRVQLTLAGAGGLASGAGFEAADGAAELTIAASAAAAVVPAQHLAPSRPVQAMFTVRRGCET
jgi:hypothetical protein